MSDLKDKILLNIYKGMENNMLSNDDLVQIIEQCGNFLNLQFARRVALAYNVFGLCVRWRLNPQK